MNQWTKDEISILTKKSCEQGRDIPELLKRHPLSSINQKIYQLNLRICYKIFCVVCGKEFSSIRSTKKYCCKTCKDRYYTEMRHLEALFHYSNGLLRCASCDEARINCLELNHLEDDGYMHREQLGKNSFPSQFYRWLKLNGYPTGFNVLCSSCNWHNYLKKRFPKFSYKNENSQMFYHRQKMNALFIYSQGKMECAQCDENDIDVLTIDHINGGGTSHRKNLGVGGHLSLWLKNEKYPDGFQVLCRNCNREKELKYKENLQKHILSEIMNKGIVTDNEKGRVFNTEHKTVTEETA